MIAAIVAKGDRRKLFLPPTDNARIQAALSADAYLATKRKINRYEH